MLGPTFGFRIGCDVTEGLSTAQKCGQVANGPSFKKTDIGGIVYAGFDVRYTTGMTSINTISADALKNRTLSIQTHLGLAIF